MRLTLIAFALAGCSRKDKTSVVVVINSHDIAPEDVTGVAVAITINQTKNIELPVAGAWPVKFVLTPAAKASETFALTVAAYKDIPANVVVSSGVISEFSPGQVGVVEIWLDRACVGVTCASDDKVCVMGTCDSDKKQPFRQWKPKDGAQDAGVANDGGVGAADAATCVGTESICELNTPVTCVAGFLVVEPECAGRCESGVCLDECRATQKKCDGRDQYECIEGKWARAMTCPFACQGGSCSGECREGERKCLDKAAMVCDAVTHKFVSDKDCAGQCMGGFCAGECTASEIRCNGKTPYVCQSDKTWKASDECSFFCNPAAPQGCSGVCEPRTRRCGAGKTLQTCDATGQWAADVETCPYTCRDGVCGGICSPGDKKCQGRKALVCDDTGQWATPTDCPFACVANICSGECVPSTSRCSPDSTATQTCGTDGMWKDVMACANKCNASSVTCNMCPVGKTECAGAGGSEIRTCGPEGTWGAAQACAGGCTEGSCNTCTEGQPRCTPDNNAQACGAGGQWGAVMPCMGKGCINGTCNQCTPNTQRCAGGKVFKCRAAGVEDAGTACAGGQGCHSDAKQCNVCQPNAKSCVSGNVVACNADGLASTITPCGNGCNQSGTDGQAQCNACKPNEARCPVGSKNRMVCNATGTAETTAACPNQLSCAPDGKNCGVCDTSGYQCTGGRSKFCSADRLNTTETDCGTTGCNSANGQCYGCKPGSTTCSGTTLSTCRSDGSGRDSSLCNSCNGDGIRCDTCIPNAPRCSNGKLEKCQGGTSWVVQESCSSLGCNDAGYCNDCKPGSQACVGTTQLKRCPQGKWEGASTCPNACVPDAALGAACGGVCKPNTTRCPVGGNASLLCNSTGTAETSSACSYGASCNAAGTGCNKCAASSRWCEDGLLKFCSPFETGWDSSSECPKGCDEAQQPFANCFTCTPGETQCQSSDVQETCTNGYWGSGTTKTCTTMVCSGVACTECIPMQEFCSSPTQLIICASNGYYDYVNYQTCPNADCQAGGACAL